MTTRHLMSTTAIAAVTVAVALAVSPARHAEAATMADGFVQSVDANDRYASNLIGSTVYTSTSPDAEAIGDVNDLILSPEGEIQAVVIGVGGFLGIGEKDVAVSFEQIEWQRDEDGDAWLVLASTREQLEAAPQFDRTAMIDDPATDDQAAMTEDPATDEQAAMTEDPVTDEQAAMTEDEMQARDQEVAVTDEPPAGQVETPVEDRTATAPADDQLQAYDPTLVSADQLIGSTVYSAEGDNVASVADVLLSENGEIDAIVIDVGGFLGLGAKPVAIGFDDLRISVDANENLILQTAFTRDQLDAAPEYDEAIYLQDRDAVIVR